MPRASRDCSSSFAAHRAGPELAIGSAASTTREMRLRGARTTLTAAIEPAAWRNSRRFKLFVFIGSFISSPVVRTFRSWFAHFKLGTVCPDMRSAKPNMGVIKSGSSCAGYTTDFNRWYLNFNLQREPNFQTPFSLNSASHRGEAELSERKTTERNS